MVIISIIIFMSMSAGEHRKDQKDLINSKMMEKSSRGTKRGKIKEKINKVEDDYC